MSLNPNGVPPKTRSTLPAADYQGFFRAVKEALELHMRSQHLPKEWKIGLFEDYPKDAQGQFDTSYDVIFYKLISARPSGMDPDGKSRVPRGPLVRDNIPSPDKAGYRLQTAAWWETVTVEFQVLAKSNKRANEIALWFHKFIYQYAYLMKFFLARGIANFQFVGREEDEKSAMYGQDLYQRRLRYMFRLDFIFASESKDLEAIHYAIRSSDNDQSPIEEFDQSLTDGV